MFGKAGNWQECARQLSRRWRVFIPELPIFDMPAHETGIENLSEYLRRFMDRNDIGRALLAGNSLGGHIALQMGLRYPGRVSAMVLTGSSGLFERGFERNVPRRPTRDWLRTKIREVFYDECHVTEALVDEVNDTICDPRRAIQILRIAKSAKRDNLRHVLHRITCPVLLAWGADDNITPPSVAREFKEFLPNAELEFIPKCGHAPMMERPHEFTRIMEHFLEKVFGPAPALEPAVSFR